MIDKGISKWKTKNADKKMQMRAYAISALNCRGCMSAYADPVVYGPNKSTFIRAFILWFACPVFHIFHFVVNSVS